MDKVKKFSQAIRLGAAITKECRGCWSQGTETNTACAVYAAVVAITGKQEKANHFKFFPLLMERFPGLTEAFIHQTYKLHDTGISREAVADWVEAQGF